MPGFQEGWCGGWAAAIVAAILTGGAEPQHPAPEPPRNADDLQVREAVRRATGRVVAVGRWRAAAAWAAHGAAIAHVGHRCHGHFVVLMLRAGAPDWVLRRHEQARTASEQRAAQLPSASDDARLGASMFWCPMCGTEAPELGADGHLRRCCRDAGLTVGSLAGDMAAMPALLRRGWHVCGDGVARIAARCVQCKQGAAELALQYPAPDWVEKRAPVPREAPGGEVGAGRAGARAESNTGSGAWVGRKLLSSDIALAAFALLGPSAVPGRGRAWVGDEHRLLREATTRHDHEFFVLHVGDHWRVAHWDHGQCCITDSLPVPMKSRVDGAALTTTGCQRGDSVSCGLRALYQVARLAAGLRPARVPDAWVGRYGPELMAFATGGAMGERVRIDPDSGSWWRGEAGPPLSRRDAQWLRSMRAEGERLESGEAAGPRGPGRTAVSGAPVNAAIVGLAEEEGNRNAREPPAAKRARAGLPTTGGAAGRTRRGHGGGGRVCNLGARERVRGLAGARARRGRCGERDQCVGHGAPGQRAGRHAVGQPSRGRSAARRAVRAAPCPRRAGRGVDTSSKCGRRVRRRATDGPVRLLRAPTLPHRHVRAGCTCLCEGTALAGGSPAARRRSGWGACGAGGGHEGRRWRERRRRGSGERHGHERGAARERGPQPGAGIGGGGWRRLGNDGRGGSPAGSLPQGGQGMYITHLGAAGEGHWRVAVGAAGEYHILDSLPAPWQPAGGGNSSQRAASSTRIPADTMPYTTQRV